MACTPREQIAELQRQMALGVRRVTVDGVTTEYRSLEDMAKAIRNLQAQDPSIGNRRPVTSTIKLTGI